jgi:hypothetical protein
VFIDSGDWDYIDNITTDEGRYIGFDAIDEMISIRLYEMSDETAWFRWGIPPRWQAHKRANPESWRYEVELSPMGRTVAGLYFWDSETRPPV